MIFQTGQTNWDGGDSKKKIYIYIYIETEGVIKNVEDIDLK